MTIQETKIKVAQLMGEIENKWKDTYKGEGEVTKETSEEYGKFAEEKEQEINSLIPENEKLTIMLYGVAAEGVSHYEIEESLQTFFKPGEGVQYDSEGGQFWMYVKPKLVHQVLRWIDFHFPGKIDLNVSPNLYAENPWFQNWSQARRYLETVVGA